MTDKRNIRMSFQKNNTEHKMLTLQLKKLLPIS